MRMYLKEAREEMGYTQGQLAELLGISANYYCDIENGMRQKDMRVSLFAKLSKISGIPASNMLRFEGEEGKL